MVIKIDDDFEHALMSCGSLPNEEFSFISHVLELMKDKRLFLFASRNFYSYLVDKEIDRFSEGVRGLLKKVTEDYTTIFSDAQNIKPLFIVTDSFASYSLGAESIVIPYRDLPYDLTPYLCCENSDDSSFYLEIFHNYNPCSNNIFIQIDGYGGGSAKSCVGNWIDNKKVFIAIADSDRKFTGDSIGGTAQNIIDVFKEKNSLCSMYYILLVHEKENLFPFEMMKPKNSSLEKIVKYVLSLSPNDEYRNFFDIKSGIRKSDADGSGSYCKNTNWVRLYKPVIDYVNNNNLASIEPNCKHLFVGVGDKEIKDRMDEGIDFNLFKQLLNPTQLKDITTINNYIQQFGYRYNGVTS